MTSPGDFGYDTTECNNDYHKMIGNEQIPRIKDEIEIAVESLSDIKRDLKRDRHSINAQHCKDLFEVRLEFLTKMLETTEIVAKKT